MRLIFVVVIFGIVMLGIYIGGTFQDDNSQFAVWFISGCVFGSLIGVVMGWLSADQKDLAQ